MLFIKTDTEQYKSIVEVFISLELQHVTVDEVLKKIREHTEFRFICKKGILSVMQEHRVSFMVDNRSIVVEPSYEAGAMTRFPYDSHLFCIK